MNSTMHILTRNYVIVSAVIGALTIPVVVGQRGGSADEVAQVLAGAIDIHVHSDPDNVPRSLDGLVTTAYYNRKGLFIMVAITWHRADLFRYATVLRHESA